MRLLSFGLLLLAAEVVTARRRGKCPTAQKVTCSGNVIGPDNVNNEEFLKNELGLTATTKLIKAPPVCKLGEQQIKFLTSDKQPAEQTAPQKLPCEIPLSGEAKEVVDEYRKLGASLMKEASITADYLARIANNLARDYTRQNCPPEEIPANGAQPNAVEAANIAGFNLVSGGKCPTSPRKCKVGVEDCASKKAPSSFTANYLGRLQYPLAASHF